MGGVASAPTPRECRCRRHVVLKLVSEDRLHGRPPFWLLAGCGKLIWWRGVGLNHRRLSYEPSVLPTELPRHVNGRSRDSNPHLRLISAAALRLSYPPNARRERNLTGTSVLSSIYDLPALTGSTAMGFIDTPTEPEVSHIKPCGGAYNPLCMCRNHYTRTRFISGRRGSIPASSDRQGRALILSCACAQSLSYSHGKKVGPPRAQRRRKAQQRPREALEQGKRTKPRVRYSSW